MYSCPGCGSNIKFDIESAMMKCSSCGNTYDPYSMNESLGAVENKDFNVMVFRCSQCGGEIMTEDNEAAAFCSYCGSSTVLEGRLDKTERPAYIIPFSKTKTDCAKAFKSKMSSAIFAPSSIKSTSNIDNFRGIYMPHWIYSYSKNDRISINATRKYQKGNYEYTDNFNISSEINYDYAGICYDASSAFADNLSQAIAPFDTGKTIEFSPAFLSGFYADRVDVDSSVYADEGKEAVAEKICSEFTRNPAFHGKMFNRDHLERQFKGHCYRQDKALFPVWFMSFRNKDRVSYMVINGQTGKVAGDIPISVPKFLMMSFAISIPIFIILNLFFTFKPAVSLVVAFIILWVAFIIYCMQVKEINARENGLNDAGSIYVKNIKNRGNAGYNINQTQNQSDNGNAVNNTKINNNNKKNNGKYKVKYLLWIIATIYAVAVFFLHPVSDLWYYSSSVFSGIVILIFLLKVVNRYNLTTSWKLPQFNRTGGDDSAVFNEEV